MNVRAQLSKLVGRWTGSNQLWLSPDEPVRQSQTNASVSLAAHDGFATITYTWADQGKLHDGVLIVRNAPQPSEQDMVWVDSFHTGGKFMVFKGEQHTDGRIAAFTTYPAPPGPDWGWRMVLASENGDDWELLMYNVAPTGEVYPAVEARYWRATETG